MRESKRSKESVRVLEPEDLRREALASNDGILISELVRKLDTSDAPVDFKVSTITEVARAHPEMTHIVNGCILSLVRLSPPDARRLCRTLVNAPFNPDRDLIIAHAAATLASIPEPEAVDAQLIAKAVTHRSEVVQTSARRAVRLLPQAAAASLLSLTETLPAKPSHDMLKRLLRPIPVSTSPGDALREHPASSPEATLTTAQTGDTFSPLVFSTPVMESLRNAEKSASSRKVVTTKRAPREPKPQPVSTTSDQPTPISPPAAPPPEQEAPQPPTQRSAPTDADLQRLRQHRIKGFHLLSTTALSNIIILSKEYREVAGALAEITLRNGVDYALQFNNRLLYSLSDPDNPERKRFDDIANAWFKP